MEIKYSISITASPTAPNYSVVMQKWGIDYNGNRIDLASYVKTGLTLAQALRAVSEFTAEGGGNG
jgi:hypothetical protein